MSPTSMSSNRTTTNTMRIYKRKNKSEFEDLTEIEPEERSLYICNTETQLDNNSSAFVIRTVKLSDLLLSSYSSPVPLRKVACYNPGYLLADLVGCGVLGSQIFFTGGLSYDENKGRMIPDKGVYTFDTNLPNKSITKLDDADLKGPKCVGLTTELCGKLYTLSCREDAPSFEVFDPRIGRWECLAQPPFFTPGSPYYFDDRRLSGNYSYLVAGTKIFVSSEKGPVCCYDVVHPEREWRTVVNMCGGCPFPFDNTALVLDIDHNDDDDKKIVFAFTYESWCLQVYLMSLCDNQETITEIGYVEIPELPCRKFGWVRSVKLIHIGGNKACVAVTQFNKPEFVVEKHYGVVIPFQYELDMTKDENNCLTLDFAPTSCCFEYNTPCYPDQIESDGCFLL